MDRVKNPLTGKMVNIGGPTFTKLYKQGVNFADEDWDRIEAAGFARPKKAPSKIPSRVKAALARKLASLRDRNKKDYIDSGHQKACEKGDMSLLEQPITKTVVTVSPIYSKTYPLKDGRFLDYLDTGIPFKNRGAGNNIVYGYNNYNKTVVKRLFGKGGLSFDGEWMKECDDYIRGLSNYDIFTLAGYTNHSHWYRTWAQNLSPLHAALQMFLDHASLQTLDPSCVRRYYKNNGYHTSLLNREPITDNIPTPEQCDIRFTRKVRIYPSTEQKLFFNKMLGANRHFFNKTNDYINNNPNDNKRFNHYYMRQRVFETQEPWYEEIPYDSRSLAVKQCVAAYKAALSNIRKGNIDRFQINNLTKKQASQVFFVDTRAFDFKTRAIFPTRLKENRFLKIKEPVPETSCSNLIILKTKPGLWFLCVPYEGKSSYKKARYKNVFIDPGSRTFLTTYNPETDSCATVGDGFVEQLMPLGLKIDRLASATTKATGRRKRNMRKRMAKIRYRMKNKVTDMHNKACCYLTERYEHIFLPHFDTNRICDSINRNIGNKAVRKIMALSHGAFRSRLEHAARSKQRSLFYVPEAYTTKTCPACGRENDIGASKWHSCGCGYEGERDRTAARNICISTMCLTN